LRTLIIPEGLKYSNNPNIPDESRWSAERLKKISDGYSKAPALGRKESIGSLTFPEVSGLVPARYDRKRIAVILEWNDGSLSEWGKSRALVYYYEIK